MEKGSGNQDNFPDACFGLLSIREATVSAEFGPTVPGISDISE